MPCPESPSCSRRFLEVSNLRQPAFVPVIQHLRGRRLPIGVINNKPWTYLHYNDIRNILNEELPSGAQSIHCSSYYSWQRIGESYKCLEEVPSCFGSVDIPIQTTSSRRIPIKVTAPDWLSIVNFEGKAWGGMISRFDYFIALLPKPEHKLLPRKHVPWVPVRLTNLSNPNPSSDKGLYSKLHKFTFRYEFTRRKDLDSCTP